jgi:hypothetical protein
MGSRDQGDGTKSYHYISEVHVSAQANDCGSHLATSSVLASLHSTLQSLKFCAGCLKAQEDLALSVEWTNREWETLTNGTGADTNVDGPLHIIAVLLQDSLLFKHSWKQRPNLTNKVSVSSLKVLVRNLVCDAIVSSHWTSGKLQKNLANLLCLICS